MEPEPAVKQLPVKRCLWPEWCALLTYAGLVAFAIPCHEPFVDEAQAWQLARNLSLGSLFNTYIRYEGSPGLWHLFLWILNRLHVGYIGMHWISGVIAVVGVSLLIFKSPLPRYLKLAFPFTYFLLFQYAVVARNYVFVPLLFFAIAIWWKKRPFIVVLILGLLANTALHAAVLSGGLAIVYMIVQIQSGALKTPKNRRAILLCALLLLAFYAFALWTAWPPHDLSLSRVRGLSTFFLRWLGSLVGAICDPMFLSVPFWCVVVIWFYQRRKLLYLLPVLFFTLFCGEVHVAFWHAGLLIPFLICVLWIIWPSFKSEYCAFDRCGFFTLGVMIFTQILWSGYALYRDHYYAYSPDAAAAEFLRPYVNDGASIIVSYVKDDPAWRGRAFPSVGIQSYFDHNIYANTPFPFWWWSDEDPSEDRFNSILPSHPQFVIIEAVNLHSIQRPNLDDVAFTSVTAAGYRYRDCFCGMQPQRLNAGATICHVIFEYPGINGTSAR